MLRFQSALAVAESFRLLQEIFPDRIDLGIARSQAATDPQTAALYDGRSGKYSSEDHAEKVAEVQRIVTGRFPAGHPLADEWIDPPLTSAGPPPIWVMSTSLNGAQLAARLGVHCSFHDYHRPDVGPEAMRRYVEEFRPSEELAQPSWNVCVAGLCVEREDEVLESSIRTLYPSYGEGRHLIFGTIDHWRRELAAVARAYRTEEIIVQSLWGTYNLEEQVASYERIAHAAKTL
jgi:alkanesulfonate monooxygenase SsuD/methylene tetrahydromethanopterin reductase-like flavin-dependent oxidoreductase (luciferase family)